MWIFAPLACFFHFQAFSKLQKFRMSRFSRRCCSPIIPNCTAFPIQPYLARHRTQTEKKWEENTATSIAAVNPPRNKCTQCVMRCFPPPFVPLLQINIPGADFDQISLQLCGKILIPGFETTQELDMPDAPSVSMVMYRTTQNVILFAETQFLVDQAAGETYRD